MNDNDFMSELRERMEKARVELDVSKEKLLTAEREFDDARDLYNALLVLFKAEKAQERCPTCRETGPRNPKVWARVCPDDWHYPKVGRQETKA